MIRNFSTKVHGGGEERKGVEKLVLSCGAGPAAGPGGVRGR